MLPEFNDSFWASFWPGFISSLITALVLTGFVAWIINIIRRPKLEVELSIAHSVDGSKHLIPILKNSGKLGLMPLEAQWYFYFDVFDFDFELKSENHMTVIMNKCAYYEVRGFNEVPCHPGSSLRLAAIPVRLRKDFSHKKLEDASFYFAMSTSRGKWYQKESFIKKDRTYILYNDSHIVRRIFRIKNIVA
ncbi:MAG: hypothetical protein R8M46_00695 [Ghiorsea sp.]